MVDQQPAAKPRSRTRLIVEGVVSLVLVVRAQDASSTSTTLLLAVAFVQLLPPFAEYRGVAIPGHRGQREPAMAAGRYRRIAAGRDRQRVLVVTTAGRRGAILAACGTKTATR